MDDCRRWNTDETENLIKGYILEKKICIVYIKQVNGGKHRAINTGAKQIVTDATLLLTAMIILLMMP
ncbi:hypothetical protein KF7HA_01506 [Lactococcus lactis]|nr:hypothetical protein [Lactococcus lactis]